MKIGALILSSVLLSALSSGCHAQVPTPKPFEAFVNWGLDPACTAANPCVMNVYRETLASASTPCDAPSSTNFKLIGSSTPNAVQFEDASSNTGGYFCYAGQTVQGGVVWSPSNTASAYVPPLPITPPITTKANQAALMEKPALPVPMQASPAYQFAVNAPHLSVRVGR